MVKSSGRELDAGGNLRENPTPAQSRIIKMPEPRFMKELEASGFLTELSRKYPIKQKKGD